METIIQKNSMVLQYGLSGGAKVEGSGFLAFPLWQPNSAKAEQVEEALVSKIEESKMGTSQSEVPLFVWIGSPGRSRTCDQPVNSRLLYH
jgi:hypothetical protein